MQRTSRSRRAVTPLTRLLVALLAASLLGAIPARLGAQQLSLGEALDRADRYAFGNRAARGAVDAARAAPIVALRGVLPSVRFDAGFVRTTDPIGTFGIALRQRAITQQDFDPARLNYPAAMPNYTGAVTLEQPLVNADAWLGRRGAQHAASATRASADWTLFATRVDVVRAFYGAGLLREKAAALATALRSAREHVRLAEAMAKQGLVTSSDALLASVKAGDVEAQLLTAEGEVATAARALATAMGAPDDTALVLPAAMPNLEAVRAMARQALEAPTSGERADVQSAEASAEAASADVLRARSLYLPRLNGFARYDWNSALRPYGGARNWTVGVMASWTPFAGASEIGDGRASAARRSAADAVAEGTRAQAALEVVQTTNALRIALARLDIVERSVRQSAEAHRIVTRKYEGGLAAVVELLDAAATETQASLGRAAAVHDLIIATAERRRALGLDPGSVRALDEAPLANASARHP